MGSRKIDDKLLFSLLKKKFKNNTCNFKDFKILTPILINVYLHHLDLELEKLKKNQNSNFKRFKIRYVRYLNFFLIGIIGDFEKNYQKINRYTLTFCNSNLKLLLA